MASWSRRMHRTSDGTTLWTWPKVYSWVKTCHTLSTGFVVSDTFEGAYRAIEDTFEGMILCRLVYLASKVLLVFEGTFEGTSFVIRTFEGTFVLSKVLYFRKYNSRTSGLSGYLISILALKTKPLDRPDKILLSIPARVLVERLCQTLYSI